MSVIYQLAEKKDISRLLNFRWDRVYERGDFFRQDMRAFKSDFRFFLNTELNNTHRCYYVAEDDHILGTIYWTVQKDFKLTGCNESFSVASFKYFESVSTLDQDVFEKLLELVIESCKNEGVYLLCSLYREENAKILIKHGFQKDKDVLKRFIK